MVVCSAFPGRQKDSRRPGCADNVPANRAKHEPVRSPSEPVSRGIRPWGPTNLWPTEPEEGKIKADAKRSMRQPEKKLQNRFTCHHQFSCKRGCLGCTMGSGRHQKPTPVGPLPSKTHLPNLPLRSSISLRVSWGFLSPGRFRWGRNLTGRNSMASYQSNPKQHFRNFANTGKNVIGGFIFM